MAHKKLAYSDFPKKFDFHVVIDTRTMTTYPIRSKTAVGALISHIEALGPTEFDLLPDEDKREITDVVFESTASLITGRLLGNATTDSLFDVIKAGPFQVTACDIDRKNMKFALDRYIAIVGGAPVTEEDLVAAAWVAIGAEASRIRREDAKEKDRQAMKSMLEQFFGEA